MKKTILIITIILIAIAIITAVSVSAATTNCDDNGKATMYTGNSGTYTLDGTLYLMNSTCRVDGYLKFEYCITGVANSIVYYCENGCSSEGTSAKCLASTSPMLDWLKIFNQYVAPTLLRPPSKVEQNLIRSAMVNWLNQ